MLTDDVLGADEKSVDRKRELDWRSKGVLCPRVLSQLA